MLSKLYPYEYVDSVFSIDFDELYKNGYRGLIFDIDNTLVHHIEYFSSLHFQTSVYVSQDDISYTE